MPHVGELAAIATAACFVGSSVYFTGASEKVGSMPVNLIRLLFAIPMFMLFGWVTRGLPFPTDATADAWIYLSLSGVVGFAFGDLCLFRSFVLIGPRLGTLLMSLAPPLTAVISFAFLKERMSLLDLFAMLLIVLGVGWAVMGRRAPKPENASPEHKSPAHAPAGRDGFALGVVLGLCGALGQAGGLVLSKHGMGAYDPFAATQIRVFAGSLAFGILFVLTGRVGQLFEALRDRGAMRETVVGTIFGPFIGVGLSLLAVQKTHAGVAASLMALTPIFILPVSIRAGEDVGVAGVAGAILAVCGVAVLFLA